MRWTAAQTKCPEACSSLPRACAHARQQACHPQLPPSARFPRAAAEVDQAPAHGGRQAHPAAARPRQLQLARAAHPTASGAVAAAARRAPQNVDGDPKRRHLNQMTSCCKTVTWLVSQAPEWRVTPSAPRLVRTVRTVARGAARHRTGERRRTATCGRTCGPCSCVPAACRRRCWMTCSRVPRMTR